jgi:putative sigma-54 modulation protein
MNINITARHFKAHQTLIDEIKQRIESIKTYDVKILHTDVVLSFERAINSIKTVEIIMKINDRIITAKESSDDYMKSLELVIEKIEAQLYKYVDKHKTNKHHIKHE